MDNVIFFEIITQPKILLNIISFIIILLVIFIGIIFVIKNTSISINEKYIIIKSFPYGKIISMNDVILNETKEINLKQIKDFNVRIRTKGISIPNFLSGWMRLYNGQKALVYLTNREKALLIPTNDFIILFST